MLDSLRELLDSIPAPSDEKEICPHCGTEISWDAIISDCDECGRDGCDECLILADLHEPTEKESIVFLCKKCLEDKYEVVKK